MKQQQQQQPMISLFRLVLTTSGLIVSLASTTSNCEIQCLNGGFCTLKRVLPVFCECPPGFDGRFCEIDINGQGGQMPPPPLQEEEEEQIFIVPPRSSSNMTPPSYNNGNETRNENEVENDEIPDDDSELPPLVYSTANFMDVVYPSLPNLITNETSNTTNVNNSTNTVTEATPVANNVTVNDLDELEEQDALELPPINYSPPPPPPTQEQHEQDQQEQSQELRNSSTTLAGTASFPNTTLQDTPSYQHHEPVDLVQDKFQKIQSLAERLHNATTIVSDTIKNEINANNHGEKSDNILVISLSVGIVLAFVGLMAFTIYICRQQQRRRHHRGTSEKQVDVKPREMKKTAESDTINDETDIIDPTTIIDNTIDEGDLVTIQLQQQQEDKIDKVL